MWRIKQALRRVSSASNKTRNGTRKSSSSSSASYSSPKPSVAAETALKTPELLEMILVNIDINDLLFMQRVCRHWKYIIQSSIPLRRKLYLSPTSKIDERIPIDNAWLKTRFPSLGIYLLQGNPKWRPKFVKALEPSDFENLGAHFFAGPEVSWRDMLLTQPPITEVVVYASLDGSRPSSRAKRNSSVDSDSSSSTVCSSTEKPVQASVLVKTRTGVTMGMLVDAGIEAQRRALLLARKRLAMVVSERTDSGYVSVGDECEIERVEVDVVDIVG